MSYPFNSITINDREILLNDIFTFRASPQSEFEQSSFNFINRWYSEEQEFLLQTSGSTGQPKNIPIKRWQMVASAAATAQALALRENDTALICLDPKYIAGQMMFVRSFNTGMRIIATDPTSNPLLALAEKTKIDFTAMVPFQLYQVLKSPVKQRLNSIRTVIIGGAAVSSEIIQQLNEFSCSFLATYGMTETISHIALQLLNGPEKSDFFTALPGVQLESDERGCLKVEVPYLNHPLNTNDLVNLVSSNQFEWLGRIDNIINSGGVKVSPERIERKLEYLKAAISLHARLVVCSRDHPGLGEEIICVLEKKGVDKGTSDLLIQNFPKYLDRFEVPKAIYCVFPFPETKTGKIDRTALKNAIRSHDL
jgi:o-succinylbenzoate---CoA ligase